MRHKQLPDRTLVILMTSMLVALVGFLLAMSGLYHSVLRTGVGIMLLFGGLVVFYVTLMWMIAYMMGARIGSRFAFNLRLPSKLFMYSAFCMMLSVALFIGILVQLDVTIIMPLPLIPVVVGAIGFLFVTVAIFVAATINAEKQDLGIHRSVDRRDSAE